MSAAPKARCGWPKPFMSKGNGVHCSECHGRLRFDLHLNQWVHESAAVSR